MTDAGRNEDDVALLQTIALGTHQIFRIAVAAAAKNFVKGVAVKLQHTVGVAFVLMHLGEMVGHFQFLIQIVGIQSQLLQTPLQIFIILCQKGRVKVCGQYTQIFQFHPNSSFCGL